MPLERFSISYPWLEPPSKLQDNLGQVIKIGEKEEYKLAKEGLTDEANILFQKLIDYGALRKIPAYEQAAWAGPVHYVSLQHVVNPQSTTTPLRLVTNSSLRDKSGLSVNTSWPEDQTNSMTSSTS